jgi:glycosyl transferase family 2
LSGHPPGRGELRPSEHGDYRDYDDEFRALVEEKMHWLRERSQYKGANSDTDATDPQARTNYPERSRHRKGMLRIAGVGNRILRMLAIRDEADVLPYNLDWYANAGFPTVAIDNGSSDGSYELCQQALGDGRLEALERVETEQFEWRTVLGALFRLAVRQKPDYLMLTAADEFFEVADGGDLIGAMREDFAAGYNVLRLTNMEFHMTEQDDPAEPNPLVRMRYYTCRRVRMARAYPYVPGLDILTRMGHSPVFPPGIEARVSPRAYVSRHYPFRTPGQAVRKLARLTDRPEGEIRRQYLRFSGDPAEFLTKRTRLFRYRENHAWRWEDKAMGERLKKTEYAFARLHVQFSELQAEHAALRAAYDHLKQARTEVTDGATSEARPVRALRKPA